jgi:hypothetical protein
MTFNRISSITTGKNSDAQKHHVSKLADIQWNCYTTTKHKYIHSIVIIPSTSIYAL